MVAAHVPADTPVAILSAGDDAMLALNGRQAWHFPPSEGGLTTDYTSTDSSVAIAQLELLRSRGAGFLVVPATAQAWLARQPDFERYVEARYPIAAHEDGIGVIYSLAEPAAATTVGAA